MKRLHITLFGVLCAIATGDDVRFRRAVLCTPVDAAGIGVFAVAATRLRRQLGLQGVLVEFGADVSSEGLAQGYTHAMFASSADMSSLNGAAIIAFTATANGISTTPCLEVPFAPDGESAGPGSPGEVRHLVLWRFDESSFPDGEDPVAVAEAGYRHLPDELPYFANLETGRVSAGVGTAQFPLSTSTLSLFSTFLSPEAEEAFVQDNRRKQFKADFVADYLAPNGCLVFDFAVASPIVAVVV